MGKILMEMEVSPPVGDGSYKSVTDSGDHTIFDSGVPRWSLADGFVPSVRPDGIVNGAVVSAGTAADTVDVSAGLVDVSGVRLTVPAAVGLAVPRGAAGKPFIVHAMVVAAGAFAVVSGVEEASAGEGRGDPGAAPWIPVGSVMVGQVDLDAEASAVVKASEIRQVPNASREEAASPQIDDSHYGQDGLVVFYQPLAAVHSDDAGATVDAKPVWAQFYTPLFAPLTKTSDYTPSANSFSTASDETHSGPVGYDTSSLSGGTFTQIVSNGVKEPVPAARGDNRWFRTYPDKNDPTVVIYDHGKVGVVNSYPGAGNITIAVTIAAKDEAQFQAG